MLRCALLPLFAFAIGCAEDTVILSGIVGEGPDEEAVGLAGADVEIIDTTTNELLVSGATNADGEFDFLLPVGLEIAALVRSDTTVTTSFVGQTGFIDVTLDPGTLYGLSAEEVASWRADFEGCPGVDEDKVILGLMAFTNLAGEEGGENPIAAGGRARLFEGEDEFLPCYLDSKTGLYSNVADRTGNTGRFGFFGAPTGNTVLDVVFEWAPESFDTPGLLPVYIPDVDEEVVVPYLPLRLTFPIATP
ncbi:MAG: hypothetical protein AAF211_08415 [Myxococcota bacterium]